MDYQINILIITGNHSRDTKLVDGSGLFFFTHIIWTAYTRNVFLKLLVFNTPLCPGAVNRKASESVFRLIIHFCAGYLKLHTCQLMMIISHHTFNSSIHTVFIS